VDVPELLERAAVMVPLGVTSDAGAAVADVREYLDHNEWEVAVDLLAELDEGWPVTTGWWDLLIEAAEQMWLPNAAAWYHWRRWETLRGCIRAELRLVPAAEGGRRTSVPGQGVLRPLWDIGLRTAAGSPDLQVARIWVEHMPELAAGGSGMIRLAPLTPASWRGLRPGHTITMHERRPVAGTAAIIETTKPVPGQPQPSRPDAGQRSLGATSNGRS
jgi:hypothetical protein